MAVSDLSLDPTRPLNYVALAMQTEGYSATDLRDLVGRAVHQAAIRLLGNNIDSYVRVHIALLFLSPPYPTSAPCSNALPGSTSKRGLRKCTGWFHTSVIEGCEIAKIRS